MDVLVREEGPPVPRILIALFLLLLAGCSPRLMLVNKVADELATQSQAQEDDLILAREASAFYLKFSESLLAQTPEHAALGASVVGGFTQYAYAFVSFEAERIASNDAATALRLRQRAARLYERAYRHGMSVFEKRHPGFLLALSESTRPLDLAPDEIGLAYWTAAAWGACISLSKDKPDVVADLPQAIRLARAAWQQQPGWEDGSLASLMGTFEASRPGGSQDEARKFFDQAAHFSGGRNASVLMSRAEALHATDREGYERLLREALQVAAEQPGLANRLVVERATWLLETADDRF